MKHQKNGLQVFYIIAAPKNCEIHEKAIAIVLFSSKMVGLACIITKKGGHRICFPTNFTDFSKTPL